MSDPIHGPTLLRVTPAAFYRLIPRVCGPVLLLGGMLTLGVPRSRGTGVLLVLAGLILAALGIRERRLRTVLLEVTEHGIMIHANTDSISVCFSLLRDLFIPWERLEHLRVLRRRQISAEHLWVASGAGGFNLGEVIVLKLRMDATWPPPGTLREGLIVRRAKPGEIYLKIGECSPGGKKLWIEMASIAARYGKPNVIAGSTNASAESGRKLQRDS